MSDTSYGVFQHYGTAAQRAAFTPSPPATGQPIYIWYETDTGNSYLYHTAWAQITTASGVTVPQGRLTLTTAVPVLVSTVTAATTIYYSPYSGNLVPIYNGTVFTPTVFTELSQTTTDNTKSPAAVGNNSNYDLFVWSDGGTMRCTRGPAWTSDTGRGTGAGTTQLTRVLGILLNTVDITNGPAASRGTYVGTVRSNGSAQIDMIFGDGTGAAGGQSSVQGLWNMYNRRATVILNFDNTNSWTWTTATLQIKNANSANRIGFLTGFQEDRIAARHVQTASNSTALVFQGSSIGLNSESAYDVRGSTCNGRSPSNGASFTNIATLDIVAPLGYNYVAPLETSTASGTSTWYGDNGSTTSNMVSMFSLNCFF